MDNATLVGPEIEGGKQLVRALDGAGLDVKAAFWLYLEEAEEWRLYIATPLVKKQGPRDVYSRVLKVLKENMISSIDLSEISVIDPTDGLAAVLSLAFQTGPTDIKDIKVVGSAVNGVYVRAAHIYRMNVR
jgi:hypothetical protein